jgi:hypothetical protein
VQSRKLKKSKGHDKDLRVIHHPNLVHNQLTLSSQVPPINVHPKGNMLLLERVMKGVLEVMMEKILFRIKLKNHT